MNPSLLKSLLITFSLLTSFHVAAESRTPIEILQNTKEDQTSWITVTEVAASKEKLFSDPSLSINVLMNVFQQTVMNHPWNAPCELNFLNELAANLKQYRFPSDAEAVQSALVLFRDQNWIDDLIYAPLSTFSEESCPTGPENTRHSLAGVYRSMSVAKDRKAAPPSSGTSKEVPNGYSRENRTKLYQTYNGVQIGLLSSVYERFSKRMLALSAEIRIQYQDQSFETYPLSPQEQYRMSAKMLHKEMEELKISTLFTGTHPDLPTIITAGMETGAISPKDVEAILSVQEIWDPKTPKWLKTYRTISKFAVPALLFVPAPGNIISDLAVAIVEVIVSAKTKPRPNPENQGITIF